MNLPEPFPERPVILELKGFSFGEFIDNTNQQQDFTDQRLIATDLFSLFTADIIRQDVLFTR